MKEEKQPKEPKESKQQFIVSDKEQEEIAKSYDIEGPFGIGMIKGK